MKLTEEQIKSIAEKLEEGLIVYWNIETKEIIAIIDYDNMFNDLEPWEKEIKEIEENREKYIVFEKMDSRESFQVMAEFVETVEDEKLKEKLELGLRLSKPFRNFKDIIDDEKEYKKRWFAFKSASYIEYVKEQLERYNDDINSDE